MGQEVIVRMRSKLNTIKAVCVYRIVLYAVAVAILEEDTKQIVRADVVSYGEIRREGNCYNQEKALEKIKVFTGNG